MNAKLSAILMTSLIGCDRPTQTADVKVNDFRIAKQAVAPARTVHPEADTNLTVEIPADDRPLKPIGERIRRLETLVDEIAINSQAARDLQLNELATVRAELSQIRAATPLRRVIIFPEARAFVPISSTVGQLLLAVKDVAPFLDGQKITFEIGNPQDVTFDRCTMKIEWGAGTNSYSKDENILQSLQGGRWTDVEVALTPAKTEDVKLLFVSLSSETVSLRPSPK